MRPAGDVRLALIRAAHDLFDGARGATLAELTQQACIGRSAARHTVPALKRSGALRIVGERRVDYRNRPVAEYAPAAPVVLCGQDPACTTGWVDLGQCLQSWAR